MKLTITVADDRIVNVEIGEDDDLSTLKALLEAETGISTSSQVLLHNGNVLAPNKLLKEFSILDGDLIIMESMRPTSSNHSGSNSRRRGPQMRTDGSAERPEELMALLRSAPEQLHQLPSAMQEAVRSDDVERFQTGLRELAEARKRAAEEEERFLKLAAEDPLNPEVQTRLEQAIQRKNVEENFKNALEYNPEAFASVIMLYVDMEVNGIPLKAFVDSGAQMTIMSKSCAERCGILRLMDTRFQGTAVGVGKAQILGRVHMAPLKAGGEHIPISITVLDQEGMDFLFGLDNLKRHQCSIDLFSNTLRFPNLNIDLPFLPEHEIPKNVFTNLQQQQQQQQDNPSASVPKSAEEQELSPPTAPDIVDEEKVRRLMQLGFTREQVIAALEASNGNEDVAGSLLFSF